MSATMFRRILAPHDLTDSADAALEVAARLAHEHDGSLTVLFAVTPIYPMADPYLSVPVPPPESVVPETTEMLEARVAKVLRRIPITPTIRVRVGYPAETILAAAPRASLIVMATHGRTGIPHLLLGSVTERVVRLSPKPVLTVRPKPAKSRSKKRTR